MPPEKKRISITLNVLLSIVRSWTWCHFLKSSVLALLGLQSFRIKMFIINILLFIILFSFLYASLYKEDRTMDYNPGFDSCYHFSQLSNTSTSTNIQPDLRPWIFLSFSFFFPVLFLGCTIAIKLDSVMQILHDLRLVIYNNSLFRLYQAKLQVNRSLDYSGANSLNSIFSCCTTKIWLGSFDVSAPYLQVYFSPAKDIHH
jgi:hypothetical protein